MDEARRRGTEEMMVQGERVRLEYKRGRKTYIDECLGGVARTIGNRYVCCKYCTPLNVYLYEPIINKSACIQ